ncbi:ATP-binding cassette domain-containing protein, partial [Paenarthrobacter sp. RAF9]
AEGWGWRHAGRATPAIQGLDLRIEPGERVLLLGPSGAGKSTLLHALAGVLGDEEDDSDETGSLLLDGASPREQRGRAGLMQQDPETQVVLSRVGDDVAFGAENLAVRREEIWARVHEALDDVGLRTAAGGGLALDHPTAALSGGQKQRLALAGILAMRPGLILLDEPTANLDPAGVLEVRDAVGRCLDKTGATLVVVEHRVSVWKDLVDRIVVLQPGSGGNGTPGVLLDGAPEQVLSEARTMLMAAGVWVPGYVPATRARRSETAAAQLLLAAQDLAVSREKPRRKGFRTIPPVPVQSDVSAQVRAGQALTITGPNVATVLAAHPKVLVLDEPTFGQDANTWAELASFLSELLDAGTAVVSVTHDQEFSAVLGGTELRLDPAARAESDRQEAGAA